MGLRHPGGSAGGDGDGLGDAADTGFTTSAAGNAELDTGDNSSLSDYAAKIIYSANISAETTEV